MQSINLQIAPGSVNPVINVSQNDVGRQFQLKLYDGAAAYTLPTGTTASIEGIKPDGHAFSYSDAVSVSGNTLTVTTKLQMTVVAGRVTCEIRLRKSGLDIGSLNFVMIVEESPLNENVDVSDTEIPAIVALAENQVEDAEAWAKGTRNSQAVPSTDPAYHNNSKWYAEHVASSLGALSDVDIASVANGDVLEYNSTAGKWKNSNSLSQTKQALSDEAKVRAKYGAHNFLNTFDYYDKSETGTAVWKMNADGTWTITGTVGSSQSYVNICARNNPKNKTVLKAGKAYRITGIPAAGCSINIIWYKPDSSGASKLFGLSSDPILEAVDYDRQITFQIGVPANTNTGSGYTFEPMISDPDDPYTGYTPFAKPNDELTKDDSGLTANAFENGAVNLAENVASSKVENGVQFVVNSDKTVNVVSDGTGGSSLIFNDNIVLKAGRYKIITLPESIDGGYNKVQAYCQAWVNGSWTEIGWVSRGANDSGDEFHTFSADTRVRFVLSVYANHSYNFVAKPMITVADMPNSDYNHYVPYAKSNFNITNIINMLFGSNTSKFQFAYLDSSKTTGAEKCLEDLVSSLGTLSENTVFVGLHERSGVRCFIAYLYSNKLYGACIAFGFSETDIAFTYLNNGTYTRKVIQLVST